jgi:hypothetical protein
MTQEKTNSTTYSASMAVLFNLQQAAFNGAVNAQNESVKQAWLKELKRVNKELMAAIDFEIAMTITE